MKTKLLKFLSRRVMIVLVVIFVLIGVSITLGVTVFGAANANPTWYVGERLIYHGQANPYDYYAAKDPTIVYADGRYHVFYTGANQSGGWQMLYTSATTLNGLKSAPRQFMNSIQEGYFCAPQVFYFEPHGLWYLIYQDGTYGCAYATTKNIGNPNSWSGPHAINISGNTGLDYFVVCDDNYAYMYNSPNDRNVYVRRTSLSNFPQGWGSPSVAIRDTWEGHNIYKSLADGQYYMMVEDYLDQRYYELWTSSNAGGPWTQIAEKWAYGRNLSYTADRWTTMVSHGEVIRAGINQKMEINDINRVDFLIQGTTSQSGEYQQITWDLGIIRNYSGTANNTTNNSTTNNSTTNNSTTNSSVPSNGTYNLINRHSGQLLEVVNADTSDGANVQQWPNNGHACQKWRLQATDNGYYKIFNVNSGKLLEVQYASTDDGANVAQWGETGDNCQQWRFQATDNGYYILLNRRSGKALDLWNWSTSNGANIAQWSNTGGNNQQWMLSSV